MSTGQSNQNAPACVARLVGSFALAEPAGGAIVIQGRRTRAMLAYLLLAPGQSASRERLAGLFWGDRGDSQARASLRQCLLELKGSLARCGDELFTATREAVTLVPGAFACDAQQLRDGLDRADWQDAVALVEAAGSLRLLEDLELRGDYMDWLDLERAGLDRAIGTALALQIERVEAGGDAAAVKAIAGAWLRRDPIAEIPVAALIRAELAAGAQAAAHRHYQAFKAQLESQLGVSPGPLVESALRGGNAVSAAPAPTQSLPPAPARAAPTEPVLAVLAFDNLSSDAELGYFCDGISEEIQRTVAGGTALKVVARASSFQFRGGDQAVETIAAALGASHLLFGSVRRGGNRVRIGAELVEAASTHAIWSDRFDGDLDDVFALQEDIAGQVARALQVTLAATAPQEAPEARLYELFLRARGLLAAGDAQFDDSATLAIPLLEEVVGAAPAYAPAWEQLALARAQALRLGRRQLPFEAARDDVIAAARTALDLDPRCLGARLALAMLEPWGAYAKREHLLLEALGVAPRDPVVLSELSQFCWGVGRFREALAYAEQACELNPLMPAARLQVAQMQLYVGNFAAGIRMHQELRRLWPDNPGILVSLLNSAPILGFWDAFDEAVGDIAHFDGWQASDMRATRAFAEALRSREPTVVEKRIARYASVIDSTGSIPLNLVVSIAALGQPERALDLAEQATFEFVFDRDGMRPSAYFPGTVMGQWSAVTASPRFVALCARLGLCDYWVKSGHWPDCVQWTPYDLKAEARRLVESGQARSMADRAA